jgi:hypothetical protein
MGYIDSYVKSPLAGIAPWVLLSIVSGPGRFEEAASAALGLTLLTLCVGSRRGVPVHTLEVFGAVFFAVLSVLGLVASDDVIGWLETWAGELSNIALAAFAIVTLVIGRDVNALTSSLAVHDGVRQGHDAERALGQPVVPDDQPCDLGRVGGVLRLLGGRGGGR